MLRMTLAKLCAGIALALGTLASVPAAQAAPDAELAMAVASDTSRKLYREGHAAIERQDWAGAVERFRELERAQRGAKEPIDAALYWQAYALVQLGRRDQAGETVERLLDKYPESAWADDARALGTDTVTIQTAAESPAAAREEDLLMAIDALLASGSKRSVPLLQKVLAGKHSDKVKSRAMFVLSQHDASAADQALTTILAGPSSKELKTEAIRMVAAGGRRGAMDRMGAMYRETNDKDIREAIIEACVISGRGDLLRGFAKSETDKRLRERAIHAMGAVGDREGLAALYAELPDEGKMQVLQGLGIAGARAELQQIVRTDASPRVRAEALRQVGVSGGKGAGAAIADVFISSKDETLRDAAIDGLIICGCSKQLADLYRRETDRAWKRRILQALSATGGDEAIDLIDEMLGD